MSGKKKIVCVSGGFDPLHAGHIRLIKEARRLGNALVVILNNDNWLLQKKKFVFMKEKERKEVLEALRNVDRVVISSHKKGTGDTSVSAELKRIKPSVFANGGDRKSEKDIPEAAICRKLRIKMVFNIGKGGKIQSSSSLAKKVIGALSNVRGYPQSKRKI
ncbi:MAG: hypothetical protein A3G52_01620 [Candidatus Taylorbacteria bacterium RIFCSPLOWO2_12_FULL_43_20]|uniref:Cytidyltransferase-like domain-containing protein n=1 Tax=Candidatus Taylorbacteria bacterium RIFCSPLOWO2_12_FULL_43_20 TaxID=1802332 RepID=A0A1G2P227_9BACT|nr:MAG: hypothetical protein A2825_00130 [Candidatus Taylorbacteria bacterium RIFCSPHIGHO2_01_FULL_43_120]OHA22130.1 MAG: hypothetical protein A3B98_03780 [Candidatus Taylorbacteria bacterium RIFCSPHIGHO2_02_FULL_43_55]OHA30424.1 MAG: hypothetical protein A3E92_04230 [Candidatus Taylorbacteria bacterium RIFCSPHIGHO2_12_FULL_42_34]OHA32381.1 MAG: hypothetical protein A3B09_03780 [Candidatus Taylorbacteria bacterium RIFCSPLOWO2_01_FULL_43_83]OHA37816.1 MAG: hypothetical protein A3H58_02850 [Candi